MIRNRLTSVQRMEVTDQRIGENDVLTNVLQTDIDTLRRTLEEVDSESFYNIVDALIDANKIYIMGIRSAESLASFMSYYFTHIFEDVRNVDTSSTSIIFEQLMRIKPEDIFIGITFSRYSRRTYKAAAFAKAQGSTVVAITDSLAAPICRVSDYVLVAKNDMTSFVDSLVAPLSLINALIVAIGLERKDEIRETYEALETIWEEYSVYEKDDDTYLPMESDET